MSANCPELAARVRFYEEILDGSQDCKRCRITRQETNALAEKLRKAKSELFYQRIITPKNHGTHVLCEAHGPDAHGYECYVDLRTGKHSIHA